MISREDVVRAYQLILERQPESEATIREWSQARNLGDLVYVLVNSEEFSRRTYLQKARGFAGAGCLVDQR